MKGVICDIPKQLLDRRARTGADRFWIDRDTKAPEVHVLRGEPFERLSPDAEG